MPPTGPRNGPGRIHDGDSRRARKARRARDRRREEPLGAQIGAGAGLDGASGAPQRSWIRSILRSRSTPTSCATPLRAPGARAPAANGSPASRRRRPSRAASPCARCRRCFTATGARAMPFSGSGTEQAITGLTRKDLLSKYRRERLQPDRRQDNRRRRHDARGDSAAPRERPRRLERTGRVKKQPFR